ncbi:hypothetical protein DCM91_19745 [Chitinophaga costaii]|nr:hypothetical protein DCM91_19745 [Chitinophaga costaii]
MTDDELMAFEIKVKENETWRRALEKQQAKQLLHRHAFEKRMANRNKEPERRSDRLMPQLMISIAIGACILASLLFLSPWKKNIYLQFSSVEMALPDTASILQQQAAKAFNRRHFKEALQLLDKQLAQFPSDTLSLLYKGVSLMELDSLASARKLLQSVYAEEQATLRYEAAFYMALTYERQHNSPQAISWLVKVPQTAPNYGKAQQMLHELR